MGHGPGADGWEGEAYVARPRKGAVPFDPSHFPDQGSQGLENFRHLPTPYHTGKLSVLLASVRLWSLLGELLPNSFQGHLCLQREWPELCCPLALLPSQLTLLSLWCSTRDPGGRAECSRLRCVSISQQEQAMPSSPPCHLSGNPSGGWSCTNSLCARLLAM